MWNRTRTHIYNNTNIIIAAAVLGLCSCGPLGTVIIDADYYDPFYYGPGMPPPPVVHPLPPAPAPHPGHKPEPPKPKPDPKPDHPGNIKPGDSHKPSSNPTINPGNDNHRPNSPGGQPGKRPTTGRRH